MTTNKIQYLRSAFFDNSEDFFSLYDKDLNMVDSNHTVLKYFKVKREDIIGKNLTELVPDFKNSELQKVYKKVMLTGEKAVVTETFIYPGSGILSLRITVFKTGEYLGISSLDITDFEDVVDELQTYIYKSSHDMRSPIVNILGLTSLATKQITDIDTAIEYFNIIKQQTEKLDNILMKLWDTSKIRQVENVFQPIKFEEIIKQVLNELAGMNGIEEIDFDNVLTVSEPFFSDRMLLVSLFQNLVDNSVRYRKINSAKPYIKISVADDNAGVRIVVADNGIGIAKNLQKNVFKMFFRGTEKAHGSGLGLYTVKQCVKKLRGSIFLYSKKNVGTTVTVYLPNEKIKEINGITFNGNLTTF